MPDWLSATLPYVAPVLVGLIATAFGSSVLTVRRLRKELLDDVAISASLTGVGRGLLARSNSERATRLAAWNRYPALVPQDLIRLGVIVLFAGMGALQARAYTQDAPERVYLDTEFLPLFVYVVIMSANWYSFHTSWIWRTKDRNMMIEAGGVERDADQAFFMQTVGIMSSGALGILVIVGVPAVNVIVLQRELDRPKSDTGWVALVASVVSLLIVIAAERGASKRPTSRIALMRAEAQAYARAEHERAIKRAARRAAKASADTRPRFAKLRARLAARVKALGVLLDPEL